jgi:DNA polymerase sigma
VTTLWIALAALISAGITFVVCYFLPKQKVKERNEEIFKEEERAQERIEKLGVEYQNKSELL